MSTIHGLPCGAMIKNPPTDARDTGLIPGSGRSPGVGNGNPLQYSYLGKSRGQRSLEGYSPWGHEEQDMLSRHSHTHAFNDSWVYSCYFCSFDSCIKPYSYSRYITKPCLTLHYLAAAISDQKSKYQNTIPRFSSGEGLWLILVLCACLCVYIFCNEHGLHL